MPLILVKSIWEMAHNNTDFAKKAIDAKEAGDIESARKFLFFRRIQTEAKDYVLGVLNQTFFTLDKWINVKKI